MNASGTEADVPASASAENVNDADASGVNVDAKGARVGGACLPTP
jgi:hypothetical protein